MILFLSPAKTLKEESVLIPIENTYPEFFEDTIELSTLLKAYSKKDISNLMKVSEKIADLNYNRYQKIPGKLTEKNSFTTLCCFEGDVYKGIDEDSYSKEEWEFAQKHVRILSGLYGVLKPADLFFPYRLEMGTKLTNKRGKNLYEFWADKMPNYLETIKDEIIINLASEEYFKVISQSNFPGKIINIVFKEWKDKKWKTIGIYSKRARGVMTNWIVKNGINTPELIKNFSESNYTFSKDMSDDLNFVFTRKNS